MARRPPRRSRPRSWPELQRRVLADDYLTVAEMADRKGKARLLKFALGVIPVTVIGTLPLFIEHIAGSPWLPLVLIGMASYGAISLYRVGVLWEQRWAELIDEKRARSEQ